MSGRFPDPDDLGPLSRTEHAAMYSLHHAYVEMEQELATARDMTGRTAARADLATDGPSGPGVYYATAVSDLCTEALAFERKVGEFAWRQASACVMLGIAVWHRLLTGRPALADQTVADLAGREPTLGVLQGALQGPYTEAFADLHPTAEDLRGEDGQEVHNLLLAGIASACRNLTHHVVDGKFTQTLSTAEALAMRLSTDYPLSADPLWDAMIRHALDLAEQMPYDIANWLRTTDTSKDL